MTLARPEDNRDALGLRDRISRERQEVDPISGSRPAERKLVLAGKRL